MDSLIWPPATRVQHNRDALRFATDLTDEEFAVLEPLFPSESVRKVHRLRQSVLSMRQIEAEKGGGVSGEIFEIFGQAAAAIKPREGAFDNPMSRQKLKPFGLIGASDDFDFEVRDDFGRFSDVHIGDPASNHATP